VSIAITHMYIGSSTITWCNCIRYLGVNVESGSCFKVDTTAFGSKIVLPPFMRMRNESNGRYRRKCISENKISRSFRNRGRLIG